MRTADNDDAPQYNVRIRHELNYEPYTAEFSEMKDFIYFVFGLFCICGLPALWFFYFAGLI
jgi:hypothetical protein